MMNRTQINRTKTYVRDNMSPSRRLEFEAELENNPELKTEYLIYKAIHNDIRTMAQISEVISDPNIGDAFRQADEAIREYKQDMDSSDHNYTAELTPQEVNEPEKLKNENKNHIRKIYFYVSSIAALLLLALMFNFFVFQTDPAKLFDKYYSQAEMALNNTRGDNVNQNASLMVAYNFYSKGEMEKAATELNKSIQNSEANALSLYLKGLIEIENNNFPLAIENLSQNLTTSDALYLEKQWYLSLCYLKLGEMDEAKAALSILSESSSTYKSDATSLLRKIRRTK
ncbi:MAG: hypothetical protein K9H49_07455 [Bacteroidales bacterium]|nr:hypothetical protein [Bacteroidales bacterium]MCF8391995.1 hypothetical protein [Bacteroidales bacterium]